jgi:hypothetical protein
VKRLFLIIALGVAAVACTPSGGSSAVPGSSDEVVDPSAAAPSEAAPSTEASPEASASAS